MKAALQKAEDEKQGALTKLYIDLEKEKERAIKQTINEQEQLADKAMKKLEVKYEIHAAELNACIFDLQKELNDVKTAFSETSEHKKNIIDEFSETRNEFQRFINQTKPFHISESKYVMPSAKSIDFSS